MTKQIEPSTLDSASNVDNVRLTNACIIIINLIIIYIHHTADKYSTFYTTESSRVYLGHHITGQICNTAVSQKQYTVTHTLTILDLTVTVN